MRREATELENADNSQNNVRQRHHCLHLSLLMVPQHPGIMSTRDTCSHSLPPVRMLIVAW
jgi:hypothetical protein